MNGTSRFIPLAIALGLTLGCAGRPVETVRIPPRIDLSRHETIGVVQFEAASAQDLAPLATRRFEEAARRDQGLVRMIPLGTSDQALRSIDRGSWNPDAFRSLGEQHGLRTVLLGELSVSQARPNLRVAPDLRSGGVTAEIDATLAVRLVETESGASIWSSSARARRSVGQIGVIGGREVVFDAPDPERAYGALIDGLVEQVTDDFHAHSVRR